MTKASIHHRTWETAKMRWLKCNKLDRVHKQRYKVVELHVLGRLFFALAWMFLAVK